MISVTLVSRRFIFKCRTHHEKFRIFLPTKRLDDKSYKGDRGKLIKSWWQFAGKSMLANIKYRKGNYRAFEMSQARFMLL